MLNLNQAQRMGGFIDKELFQNEVMELKKRKNIDSWFEALVIYIQQSGIDEEDASKYISNGFKSILEVEARQMSLLKDKGQKNSIDNFL